MSLEKPMIDDAFRVLHEKAHEYIADQHELLENNYGFGQSTSYQVDWENNIINFINKDNSSLKISFQIVGTLDSENKKWSWRWNNPDLNILEIEELDIIKNYGEFYGYDYLIHPELELNTNVAWALTAISGYLRISKGIFRIQNDEKAHFVYFKEVL